MKVENTTYEKKANDFLTKTGVKLEIKYVKHDFYFPSDKEKRDIYEFTLSKSNRKYSGFFGNSLYNSGFYYTKGKQKINLPHELLKESQSKIVLYIKFKLCDYDFLNNGTSDIIHFPKAPTAYDILACLTKYDCESFENFCSEYGYDTDSRTAEKNYKNVCKEYAGVQSLWNDAEIEELSEIQ